MRYRPDRPETLCKDKSFCKLVGRGLCDKHPACKRGPKCSFLWNKKGVRCTFWHPPEHFKAVRENQNNRNEEVRRDGGRSRSRSNSTESIRVRHARDRRRFSRSRSRSRSDRGFSRSPGRRRESGKRIPVSHPWSEREERELVRYCAKHRIEGDWIPEECFHEIRDRFNREIRDIRAALLRLRCRGTMRQSNREPRAWTPREEEELIRYAEHHRIGDWLSPERTRKISKTFDRELKDIKSRLLKLRAEGRLRQTKRDQMVANQNPWREWEDQWLIDFVQKWRIQDMFSPEQVKEAKNTVSRTLNDIKTRLFKLRHDGRIPDFDAEHPQRPTHYEPRISPGVGHPVHVAPPPAAHSMAAPIDPPYEHGYGQANGSSPGQHLSHEHAQAAGPGHVYGQDHGQYAPFAPQQAHVQNQYPPQHPSQYPHPPNHQIPQQQEHQNVPSVHLVPPPPPPRPKKVVDPRDPRKRQQVVNEQSEGGVGMSIPNGFPSAPSVHQQPYVNPERQHQVEGALSTAHAARGFGSFGGQSRDIRSIGNSPNGVPNAQPQGPPPPPPAPVVAAQPAADTKSVVMKSQHNADGTVQELHTALNNASDYSKSASVPGTKTQSIGQQYRPKGNVEGKAPVKTEEEQKAERRRQDIASLSTSLEKELERGRKLLGNMKPPNDKKGQKEYITLLRRQIECLKRSNFEMFKYQNMRNKMMSAAAASTRNVHSERVLDVPREGLVSN